MSESPTTQVSPVQLYANKVQSLASNYKRALPSDCGVTPEMFVANAIGYANKNPAILEWDQSSVMGALYEGARLGLMPDGAIPGFHIIPFNESKKVDGRWVKTKKGVLVVDYKAIVDLTVRSGSLRLISTGFVYANDSFAFGVRNGERFLEHSWDLDAGAEERGELRGVYCIGTLPDGNLASPEWMNVKELDAYGLQYAKGFDGKARGLWAGDLADRMTAYQKTIVRRFLRFIPKSANRLTISQRLGEVQAADARGMAGLAAGEDFGTVRETTARAAPATGSQRAERDLGLDREREDSPGESEAPAAAEDREVPATPDDFGEPPLGGEPDYGEPPEQEHPSAEDAAAAAEREQAAAEARDAAAWAAFRKAGEVVWEVGTRYAGLTIGAIMDSDEGLLYLIDARTRYANRPGLCRALDAVLKHPSMEAEIERARASVASPAEGK